MKIKLIAFILCLFMIFSICLFSRESAYADPFTAGQIASTAYAMMQSWGIAFNAGSASASGMNNFMAGQVQDYVNSQGGSIADVFVGNIAVDVAGKLVVSQQMYNSVVGFLDWMKEKYTLSSEDFQLSSGDYEGKTFPNNDTVDDSSKITGIGIEVLTGDIRSGNYSGPGRITVYNGGSKVWEESCPMGQYYGDIQQYLSGSGVMVGAKQYSTQTGGLVASFARYVARVNLENKLSWSVPESWSMPTVLNPDKEWTGTVGGYSVPDTNLDQLLGNIDQAVADNNLVVEGEVIDIPVPTPTPAPIDPDLPLSDVPWEGLDNNLQQLYEQGLEEIGKIGDAQEAITDSVGEQTAVLEGAISDNAGVVSGAIEQAVSDVQDAISEQTQTLSESATATAEATESIAEAMKDEAIDWKKFDLRGLFPFCIPFDIYNMLKALDASPTAPHVQLPFVIESIGFSYMIDLDFAAFDPVAAIMRQMELICYGLALAWATSKVIKW